MKIDLTHPVVMTHRSGQVTRYHARPELAGVVQPVGGHSWGMLALCYKLHPNPGSQLKEAITFHDAPELIGGDWPYPFKKENPDLAEEHETLSEKGAKAAGIPIAPELSEEDTKWLRFLDCLEAVLFVQIHRPDVLEESDWQRMIESVIETARELGCYVTGRLDEILPGLLLNQKSKGYDAAPSKRDEPNCVTKTFIERGAVTAQDIGVLTIEKPEGHRFDPGFSMKTQPDGTISTLFNPDEDYSQEIDDVVPGPDYFSDGIIRSGPVTPNEIDTSKAKLLDDWFKGDVTVLPGGTIVRKHKVNEGKIEIVGDTDLQDWRDYDGPIGSAELDTGKIEAASPPPEAFLRTMRVDLGEGSYSITSRNPEATFALEILLSDMGPLNALLDFLDNNQTARTGLKAGVTRADLARDQILRLLDWPLYRRAGRG